jgi:hypothetical protein
VQLIFNEEFTFNLFYNCGYSYNYYVWNTHSYTNSKALLRFNIKNNTFINSSCTLNSYTSGGFWRYMQPCFKNNLWYNSNINILAQNGNYYIYHDNFWNSLVNTPVSFTTAIAFYENPYLLVVDGETTAYLTESANSDFFLTGGYEQDLIGAKGIGINALEKANIYGITNTGLESTEIGADSSVKRDYAFYYDNIDGKKVIKTDYDSALLKLSFDFNNDVLKIKGYEFIQSVLSDYLPGMKQAINYENSSKAPYKLRYRLKNHRGNWENWTVCDFSKEWSKEVFLKGMEFEMVFRRTLE